MKSLVINEVQNGYVLVDTQENKVNVFEKGNEFFLLELLCKLLGWKDVIDFGDSSTEKKGEIIQLVPTSTPSNGTTDTPSDLGI